MKIIDLIYNAEIIKSTCCLCFNTIKNCLNIDELIEIVDEHSTYTITLRNVIKYLFLSYDLLFSQACDACTDLILKIYVLMKKATFKIEAMVNLVDRINKEIHKYDDHKSEIFINIQKLLPVRSKNYDLTTNSKYFKSNNLIPLERSNNQPKMSMLNNVNKRLVCVSCSKTFKNISSLNTHLRSHKTIKCPYCSKKLRNNSHFSIHIKSHLNLNKRRTKTWYKCDDCGHETCNKSDLSSHMYKHHLKLRPFVCKNCQKRFYSQRNLNEHVLTHIKNKTNMCELCGEQFSCKPALTNHLKLHTGHRPFKCEICNHAFVTASRKNEHVKRKHGEKQFSCTMCVKRYGLKKALNRHIRTTHGFTDESMVVPKMLPNTIKTMKFL